MNKPFIVFILSFSTLFVGCKNYLELRIQSPTNGQHVQTEQVNVQGTFELKTRWWWDQKIWGQKPSEQQLKEIREEALRNAKIFVNGVLAKITAHPILPQGTFEAVSMPLIEGQNAVIATGEFKILHKTYKDTHQITVHRDGNGVGTVLPSGGTVTLPDYASVTFGAGAFTAPTRVEVKKTSDAETQEDFTKMIGGIYLPYEIRVNTGLVEPQGVATISLVVPDSFLQKLPPRAIPLAFAQIWQSGGEELLDMFESLGIEGYDAQNKKITVTIDPGIFINLRNREKTWEVILVIGSFLDDEEEFQKSMEEFLKSKGKQQTTLTPSETPLVDHIRRQQCQVPRLGPPIQKALSLNRGFKFIPYLPKLWHFGIDYRAANDDLVLTAANGVVERNYWDQHPTNPNKGAGQALIIRHAGNWRTLYGHLVKDSGLPVGTKVTKGQIIAKADNTGGSTGPHLHFAYGLMKHKYDKIDPEHCVDPVNVEFTLSSSQLSFQLPGDGGNPPDQTVALENKGNVPLSLEMIITPDAPWLKISSTEPNTEIVPVNGKPIFTFSVDAALVPQGGALTSVTIADVNDPAASKTLQIQVTKSQSQNYVINFDDVPAGTVIKDQYPPAHFHAPFPGESIFTSGTAALFGSSPPNFVCSGTAAHSLWCRDISVGFDRPVTNVKFLAVHCNVSGYAGNAAVYGANANFLGSKDILCNKTPDVPITIDLSAQTGVKSLIINLLGSLDGVGFDDFSFSTE